MDNKMNLPACSKCGESYKPSSCYDYWTIFSLEYPERNLQIAPTSVVYYSLCPSCTKSLKDELVGYRKTETTVWIES